MIRGGLRRMTHNAWPGGDISEPREMVAGGRSGLSNSSPGRQLEAARDRRAAVSAEFGTRGLPCAHEGLRSRRPKRFRCPIPMLREITQRLGINTGYNLTRCPRSMFPPRLQSTGCVLRRISNSVPRRFCGMPCPGAARPVSRIGPLRQFALRTRVGERERTFNSNRNRSAAFA